MLKTIITNLKPAILLLSLLTILTGFVYPGTVTFLAQNLFPEEANGSLVMQNGKVIGSKLIGQYFTQEKYFWGRPSKTPFFPYNSLHSAGSNLGPTNPLLAKVLKERIDILQKENVESSNLIPVDLVTASGSGLDPEISPLAASYQINRIAKVRNLSKSDIQKLIAVHVEGREFKFLGEVRVNVLELNLALDTLSSRKKPIKQ